LLQQRPHYRIMRRHRIVEGEHDELVWNRRREAAGRRLTQRGVNEQRRELDKRSTLPAHPVPERRTTRQQSSLELDFNAQTRMTNDEIRRNDEIRMTKPATAQPTAFGHSGFGFRSSFVIRHSSFNDLCKSGSSSQCAQNREGNVCVRPTSLTLFHLTHSRRARGVWLTLNTSRGK